MSFLRRVAPSLRLLGRSLSKAPTRQFRCWASASQRFNSVRHGQPLTINGSKLCQLIALVLGGGLTTYFAVSETVPYSKRRHLVLLPRTLERWLGKHELDKLRPLALSADDPRSIRVRRIAKEITDALEREVRYKEEQTPDHNSIVSWVRKKFRPSTKHLEGLEWDVIVAYGGTNACCLPGGKIVVYTGLLHDFKTDAEIATVLGHEVGHVVARHGAEGVTKFFIVSLLMIILMKLLLDGDHVPWADNPNLGDGMAAIRKYLYTLPFSRRNEMEADYIGLLLLASAGYDPCVAPKVYEKLGETSEKPEWKSYVSTHPPGKKRARRLAQEKVMEEALSIYRQTRHANFAVKYS